MIKVVPGPDSYESTDWYAVYTRHQHEKTVAESFSRKGIEAFLPLYDVVRRWADRSKQLSLPLFPCYVFLRCGIERRTNILSTPSVHSILKIGNQLACVPNAEIDAIRRVVDSRLHVEPHPFVCAGDRVRIKSGPLVGIEGILVRKKNSVRLILSAQLIEKSIEVEVDAFSIEPLPHRLATRPLPSAFVHRVSCSQRLEHEKRLNLQ
jgi:transcription antitermination factor NusG